MFTPAAATELPLDLGGGLSLRLVRRRCSFRRTEFGARQVDIVQSLIATCRRHGLDPYDYLVDVLQRVGIHPASRVAELIPRNWKDHFASQLMRSVLHGQIAK